MQEEFVEFNTRELELLHGMIEVQRSHALRCATMLGDMAKKQKGWDLERVALLEKILKENGCDS